MTTSAAAEPVTPRATPHTDDQRATIAFLSAGASYGLPDAPVRRIETHWSIIFLVADKAYKLKRQALFSLLDYATVEKRERACRAEFEFNTATAPDLYLGLHKISLLADGTLTFDGVGPAVDWVVVMRRFDQTDLLDHLADTRRLDVGLMGRLADEVAAFHARAEIAGGRGGAGAMRAAVERWHDEQPAVEAIFEDGHSETYYRDVVQTISALEPALESRRQNGKIRRCHGYLRLANICLLDGRPTLFDAIEFSDELSCIDVLYDLAFLLMDLHQRGLAEFGNLVFNRYLDHAVDIDGLRVLPLFLSFRAAMRAQMLAAAVMRRTEPAATRLKATARSHLTLAMSLLRRPRAQLIAMGGLSSTAKSELAARLAASLGPAPGSRICRDLVARRRLMAASSEARLSRLAFDEAVTAKVYDALVREAAATLAAGMTVIVDADFLGSKERSGIADVAAAARVPFTGLWLGEREDAFHTHQGAHVLAPVKDWHWIDSSRGPSLALTAAQAIVRNSEGPDGAGP